MVCSRLSPIPQGDAQNNRRGNQALIKSIYLRFTLTMENLTDTSGVPTNSVGFIYLIQDTQCNGASAPITTTNGIFVSSDPVLARPNLSNGDRFRILKKWAIPLRVGAVNYDTYFRVQEFEEYYTPCEIPIMYSPVVSTGQLQSIRSNNIFMVVACTRPGGTVTMDGVYRLRYIDGDVA